MHEPHDAILSMSSSFYQSLYFLSVFSRKLGIFEYTCIVYVCSMCTIILNLLHHRKKLFSSRGSIFIGTQQECLQILLEYFIFSIWLLFFLLTSSHKFIYACEIATSSWEMGFLQIFVGELFPCPFLHYQSRMIKKRKYPECECGVNENVTSFFTRSSCLKVKTLLRFHE